MVKAAALFFAALLAFVGTAQVVSLIDYIDKEENGRAYAETMLEQGRDFDLEKSEIFYNEISRFKNLAKMKAFIFKDGSEKAFEDYKKSFGKLVDKRAVQIKNSILEDVELEKSSRFNSRLFDCLDEGFVSLKKVADHQAANHFSDDIYYVDGEAFFDSDYEFYFDDEPSFGGDMEETKVPIYGYTSTTDFDGGSSESVGGQNFGRIPKEIEDGAKNADAVVEICNIHYNDQYFDGYYAVTCEPGSIREYIESNLWSNLDFGVVDEKWSAVKEIETYELFGRIANENEQALNEYKNAVFAVLDNDDEKVVSAVGAGESRVSRSEFEETFFNCSWGNIYRSKNLSVFPSDGRSVLSVGDFDYCLDDGDYSLYLGFDNTFSEGDDAFKAVEGDYFEFYSKCLTVAACVLAELVGLIVCIAILIAKSGRRSGDNEIHMMITDKIFTLIRTCADFAIIAALAFAFVSASSLTRANLVCGLCSALMVLILIDWLAFIARHVKNGTILSNTVVGALLSLLKKAKNKYREKSAVYRDIFKSLMIRTLVFAIVPNVVLGLFGADLDGVGSICLTILAVYDFA